MNENFRLPIRNKIEAPMQASKWLKCPVLLDIDEMKALFDHLGNFYIVRTSGILPIGHETISKEEFLDCYASYIESLKKGVLPNDKRINSYFTSVFTRTAEALYATLVDPQRQMVQVDQPVVQLQNHRFVCGEDKKFHSMVFGLNSIYWGLQFSYPQLYQDKNLQVFKVNESSEFPNTTLFKLIQRWMREHTKPTPCLLYTSDAADD